MRSPSRPPGKVLFVGLTLVVSTLALVAPKAQSPVSELHANLFRKAEADGAVPVIIQLRSATVPEHSLASDVAVASQRQAIANAQDGFLARVASLSPVSVQRYSTIPALAFVASAELVRELLADPEVLSVSENKWNEAFLNESVPLIGASAVHSSGITGLATRSQYWIVAFKLTTRSLVRESFRKRAIRISEYPGPTPCVPASLASLRHQDRVTVAQPTTAVTARTSQGSLLGRRAPRPAPH